MGFEVLLYTDCAAHESVSGRTGFQFLAESPGATPTDEEFVKNGGLHVVSSALRPDEPDTHPQTCVYREHAGRRYLSRGRSTGQTLSGRPGNQITQAIVSGEDADVLPLRPAQLYSCPQWSLNRATTKELEPWQTPLEIASDFETAALHQMLAGDPWARDLLPQFLTMVEQATAASRTKLILKHPDQATVMRWIALASLFLDSGTALALTFRVFSADPTGDPLAIVGAHPMLSPGLTTRTAATNNQNLIDIEARESTPVAVSPAAALHAEWFLASDPYEALDAMATSGRWSRVLAPNLAAGAAALVCLPEARPVAQPSQEIAAAALAGLADAGLIDELDAYGGELVDVVATYAAGPEIDLGPAIRAAWALNDAGQHALAGTLFLTILEWSTEPAVAARWARLHRRSGSRPRLSWTDAEHREQAARLVSTLLDQAEPSDLPGLFRLVEALDTSVGVAAVAPAVERLAALWAQRSELTDLAAGWLHQSSIVASLKTHLASRLAAQDRVAVAALADGRWDWLAPRPWRFDLRDPMAVWLGARVLVKAPAEVRPALLTELSPAAPSFTWRYFLTGEDPVFSELIRWVADHPQLDESLAVHIEDILNRDLRDRPTGRTRELLAVLADRRTSGLTSTLVGLVREHDRITQLWTEALSTARTNNNRALRELGNVSVTWLLMHRPSLANAMLDCDDRPAVFALTDKVRVDKSLEKVLVPRLRRGDANALIGALMLLDDGTYEHQKVVRSCLRLIWDSASAEDERARGQLRRMLPQDWVPKLTEFERTVGKGRIARELARGARGLLERGKGSD